MTSSPASLQENPLLEDSAAAKQRVLVIDRDAVFSHLVCNWIETQGLDADRASDVDRALDLLVHQDYDIILLDVGTLGPIGAFPAAFKNWLPRQAVLLAGEFPDRWLLDYANRIGAPVLAKPFGADALLARIRTVLQHDAQSPLPN